MENKKKREVLQRSVKDNTSSALKNKNYFIPAIYSATALIVASSIDDT